MPFSKFNQLHECKQATATIETNAKMPIRRFPPPWSVEEQPAYFVVRDHSGQKLA
jgi:hypothetical protein